MSVSTVANLAVTATFATSTLCMRVSVRSTAFQSTEAAIMPDLEVRPAG